MARRAPKIDETLFPVVPLRYKDVPLTNEYGTGLIACKRCDGQGAKATASKTAQEHNRAPQTETHRIPPIDEKKWRKKGYAVTVEQCLACNGAGLVVNQ